MPVVWPKAIVPLTVKGTSGDFVPIGTAFVINHVYDGNNFNL